MLHLQIMSECWSVPLAIRKYIKNKKIVSDFPNIRNFKLLIILLLILKCILAITFTFDT